MLHKYPPEAQLQTCIPRLDSLTGVYKVPKAVLFFLLYNGSKSLLPIKMACNGSSHDCADAMERGVQSSSTDETLVPNPLDKETTFPNDNDPSPSPSQTCKYG